MQNSEYELPAAEGTPNGEVGAMDLKQLQKEKQDLEQQLTEKNKVRTPHLASCDESALAWPSPKSAIFPLFFSWLPPNTPNPMAVLSWNSL